MSAGLARWNSLTSQQAAAEILPCCGSTAWAEKMAAKRPITDEAALLAACDQACANLSEADWLEAFRGHPRIGETKTPQANSPRSAAWSREEQRSVDSQNRANMMALAESNRAYEQRFGRTFIICATGKSVLEILENLRQRLHNDDTTEFRIASGQLRQIAHLRLKKWLAA